ncbi:hypothetical protein BKA70DRAFT_1437320 [Coprinopsis sp. MPI-PUGE-AT-0042]|nr:hypothetical protein BKA70DRAFT_1437320 [Coprinopsis sp. MPI-PUGE-AT-0042]
MDPSPSSPSAAVSVSLPSIHEMFPEHLLHRNSRDSLRPSTKDAFSSQRLPIDHGLESRPYLLSGPQHPASRTARYDPLRSGHSDHYSVYQNHGAPDVHPARYSGVDRGSGPGYHVSGARTQSPSVPSVASLPSSSPLVLPRGLPADMAGMHIKEHPHPVQASSHYIPSIIAFPTSGSGPNADHAIEDPSQLSDGENPNEPSSGKKHICPTCFKRFNRPSSLRIHVNTHTGATPFRCPWPGCGREFNVNSNMRRHYRNHNAPGYTRPNGDTRRRRRRIVDPSVDPNQPSHMVDPSHAVVRDSPPGEYESDGYESDYSKPYPSDVPDCVTMHPSQEKSRHLSHHRQGSASSSQNGYGPPPIPHQYQYPPPPSAHSSRTQTSSPRHHPYAIPETRSYTPAGSSFHSSSPSPSPSPPIPASTSSEGQKPSKDPAYSASIPYLRTVTDARAVSTTLRPAFEPPAPASRSAGVRHSYAGHASGGW